MNKKNNVQSMVLAALLCAVGIIIPMYSPFKILLEPASFTLGSHVAVFIAMFISPAVAVSVAFVTALGFQLAGFPLIVVLRALTHVIFAGVGAFVLTKSSSIMTTPKKSVIFAFLISVLHAACEVFVVTIFYWGNQMTDIYYNKGYLITVVGLVGVGTIIHSMIDFGIATAIWQPLKAVAPTNASAKFYKVKKQL